MRMNGPSFADQRALWAAKARATGQRSERARPGPCRLVRADQEAGPFLVLEDEPFIEVDEQLVERLVYKAMQQAVRDLLEARRAV